MGLVVADLAVNAPAPPPSMSFSKLARESVGDIAIGMLIDRGNPLPLYNIA